MGLFFGNLLLLDSVVVWYKLNTFIGLSGGKKGKRGKKRPIKTMSNGWGLSKFIFF